MLCALVPGEAMPLSPLAFTALLSTGDELPADGYAALLPSLKDLRLNLCELILQTPLHMKEDGFGHPISAHRGGAILSYFIKIIIRIRWLNRYSIIPHV